MSNVASKNVFALLGNDSDQDSDKEPGPPARAIEKPTARRGKRDAPVTAPATEARASGSERGGRGGRRGGGYSNEDAFNDRNAGSGSNRTKPTDDSIREDRHRRRGNFEGRGRGRGGRGGFRGDRQDRTGQGEHQKQADLSWGAQTGDSEWRDERAGEDIAKAEENESGWDTSAAPPLDGEGEKPADSESGFATAEQAEEFEPKDTSKSYAEYLAEQAEKRKEGLGILQARKPNEGSKQDKKWATATKLQRNEEDEIAFIQGKEEKTRRERQRKVKNFMDTSETDKWQENLVMRSGRGDGRGRGRGDRGGRGGRGRGDGFRGGRGGRGGEGGYRGGRGAGDLNVNSNELFPSLGSK